MTVDEAFKAGLERVRARGIDVSPKEMPVLAAWFVFEKRAGPVQHDERFDRDGPRFAATVILEALLAKARQDRKNAYRAKTGPGSSNKGRSDDGPGDCQAT